MIRGNFGKVGNNPVHRQVQNHLNNSNLQGGSQIFFEKEKIFDINPSNSKTFRGVARRVLGCPLPPPPL